MSTELIIRKGLFSLLFLLVFITTPVFADQATDIIEKTGSFYADQTSLAANVTVEREMPSQSGPTSALPSLSFHYYFHSPNSVALVPAAGYMFPPVIQDGKRYFSEMTKFGSSILREAFELEAFLSGDGEGYLQLPGADILVGLGLDARVPGSLRSLTGAQLLGSDVIDETECHHLRLRGDDFIGEIWITKGEQPWVLRIHQTDMDIRISEWNASPDFGEVFSIKPNKDLKTRETMPSLEEIMVQMTQQMSKSSSSDNSHPSVGKPAPHVTLNTMGNGDISLADLKGKIVVLDFWATWCKPCVKGLPLVAKITDELSVRGVVFYAVNQRETENQVKSFLNKKGMDLRVALDKKAIAGQAFGVNGIPHSVIIDKEGVIRKVHVGFGPGTEKLLKKEILELLAE